jgi:hypothetical protein
MRSHCRFPLVPTLVVALGLALAACGREVPRVTSDAPIVDAEEGTTTDAERRHRRHRTPTTPATPATPRATTGWTQDLPSLRSTSTSP